jgi:hypothetical protein
MRFSAVYRRSRTGDSGRRGGELSAGWASVSAGALRVMGRHGALPVSL